MGEIQLALDVDVLVLYYPRRDVRISDFGAFYWGSRLCVGRGKESPCSGRNRCGVYSDDPVGFLDRHGFYVSMEVSVSRRKGSRYADAAGGVGRACGVISG